jgi:hypothetical protein
MGKSYGGRAMTIREWQSMYLWNDAIREQDGMTLRDYFAGQALAGMLGSQPVEGRANPNYERWATVAYTFADAMIAERDK